MGQVDDDLDADLDDDDYFYDDGRSDDEPDEDGPDDSVGTQEDTPDRVASDLETVRRRMAAGENVWNLPEETPKYNRDAVLDFLQKSGFAEKLQMPSSGIVDVASEDSAGAALSSGTADSGASDFTVADGRGGSQEAVENNFYKFNSAEAIVTELERLSLRNELNAKLATAALRTLSRKRWLFRAGPQKEIEDTLERLRLCVEDVKHVLDEQAPEGETASSLLVAAAGLADLVPDVDSLVPKACEAFPRAAQDLDSAKLVATLAAIRSFDTVPQARKLVEPIIERLFEEVDDMRPWHMAQVLYVCGELGLDGGGLRPLVVEFLARLPEERLRENDRKTLSRLAWGAAQLDVADEGLWGRILSVAKDMVDDSKDLPQELRDPDMRDIPMITCALARQFVYDELFFENLAARLQKRRKGGIRRLTNWDLAALKYAWPHGTLQDGEPQPSRLVAQVGKAIDKELAQRKIGAMEVSRVTEGPARWLVEQ